MAVTTPPPAVRLVGAALKTSPQFRVPSVLQRSITPRVNPKSPTRFTMKAFLPALAATSFSNQKPMSR